MTKVAKKTKATADRFTVPKTVSLPPDILTGGEKRAAQERRSFSNYVVWLIEQDINSGASAAAA